METQESTLTPRDYSMLLRVLSGFLFFGLLVSVFHLFSPAAVALGSLYQVCNVISGAVNSVAAYGLWMHRKWGAWIYIASAVIWQPVLYLFGWWAPATLIIPGICALLILSKYKWLK